MNSLNATASKLIFLPFPLQLPPSFLPVLFNQPWLQQWSQDLIPYFHLTGRTHLSTTILFFYFLFFSFLLFFFPHLLPHSIFSFLHATPAFSNRLISIAVCPPRPSPRRSFPLSSGVFIHLRGGAGARCGASVLHPWEKGSDGVYFFSALLVIDRTSDGKNSNAPSKYQNKTLATLEIYVCNIGKHSSIYASYFL